MLDMRRKLRIVSTVSLALMLLFCSTAQAEVTYPADDNSFVLDDVGILNSTEEGELEQLSIDLSDAWGTDIVLILIESTDNYTTENDTNMSLAQYTIQLFDALGIGDPEWQDGVLIVLATNQTGSWEWSYEYGLFWQEYQYVFNEWYDRIPSSVNEDLAAGNWTDALYYLVDDLSWSIDDFWYENDGWVDPPGPDQVWSTPPVLDDLDNSGAGEKLSFGDTLVSMVFCLGCMGLPILGLVFLIRRGGGNNVSVGGGGRWGRRNHWDNNQYGYPQQGGYQENNHYYGGNFNNAPSQQHSPQVSGGTKTSRKASRGSGRGSSTKRRGGGSSRGSSSSRSSSSSRGSSSSRSRGGSSGRSSGGGGSRRSGGGGGRRGGGRRGR